MISRFRSELCSLDRPSVFLYVHRNNVSTRAWISKADHRRSLTKKSPSVCHGGVRFRTSTKRRMAICAGSSAWKRDSGSVTSLQSQLFSVLQLQQAFAPAEEGTSCLVEPVLNLGSEIQREELIEACQVRSFVQVDWSRDWVNWLQKSALFSLTFEV